MKRTRCAAALTAIVLAGCSESDPATGGLPGPVPDGVTFHPADNSALPAPQFELPLISGELLHASTAWDERPMVLVFFETWCQICLERQPGINELAEQYEDVVLFVGVAGLSEEDDVRDYVSDNDVPYPVGIDDTGKTWLDYAVEEPPLVALISKGGQIVRGWPGGIDADRIREQIDEVLVADGG